VVRVLVVDDSAPFRRFVREILGRKPDFQAVGEASDGLEAVQKAEELQPDLILLDIGLPKLNGIEAARQIRDRAPKSKILFLSANLSSEIVRGSLCTGASGYVVKADAASELLPALEAVLRGKRFVSARLAGLTDPTDEHSFLHSRSKKVVASRPPRKAEVSRGHEVAFYPDDESLVAGGARFIEVALRGGSAVIVIATPSHRDRLLLRLRAQGLDVGAAIEQGRYIALDAAATISTFMFNDIPDPVRFLKQLGDLIVTAAAAAVGEQPRVAIFGECVNLLWAQEKAEAAIQVEKFANQLPKTCDLDILCGYSLDSVQGGMDTHISKRICAEHSAVLAAETAH